MLIKNHSIPIDDDDLPCYSIPYPQSPLIIFLNFTFLLIIFQIPNPQIKLIIFYKVEKNAIKLANQIATRAIQNTIKIE